MRMGLDRFQKAIVLVVYLLFYYTSIRGLRVPDSNKTSRMGLIDRIGKILYDGIG